jgi:hypothetical protein
MRKRPMLVSDLVEYDLTRNCFVLKGPMKKQQCNCHPDSPFHWAHNRRPSVFAQDITFRSKGAPDKSIGQVVTENIDARRSKGEVVGHLYGIGQNTKEKEAKLVAYKQFGIYSKAKPSIRNPNKHEL